MSPGKTSSRTGATRKKVMVMIAFSLLSAAMVFSSNEDLTILFDSEILANAINNNDRVEATDDQIVTTLMNLAHRPPEELQQLLEGQDRNNSNPFRLDDLREGRCPWTQDDSISWLPQKKSSERSKRFRSVQNSQPLTDENAPVVVIYYEHLSKAGGTSFCNLAQSNMPKEQVPAYYCMPSNSLGYDARVGGWGMRRVQKYFTQSLLRIVSSEWEPFNLELPKHFLPENNERLQMLFATTVRNPINRLLSSYKFFGSKLYGKSKGKAPTLPEWLTKCAKNSQSWKILDKQSMRSNLCRFNFAVWKFSGGTLPISPLNLQAKKQLTEELSTAEMKALSLQEEQWRKPFETAIRTLANFDLAIPMEELSGHPEPLTDMFGWTNFSTTHVVTKGKIINNDAKDEMSTRMHDILWQTNSLDMILYYWTLAVYLTSAIVYYENHKNMVGCTGWFKKAIDAGQRIDCVEQTPTWRTVIACPRWSQ
eukprot:scaffold3987_cov134-Cylindrotheca_fusiformis.AAC.8